MAGTGKSTISYTVCRTLTEISGSAGAASLGASFFCSRQVADLKRLPNIAPTLAYQLSRHSRTFAEALSNVENDLVDRADNQVEKLLAEPWRASVQSRPDTLPPTVIVIDALDEIEDDEGKKLLDDLIKATSASTEGGMRGLKILVTSRPHPDIVKTGQDLSLDNIYRLEDIEKTSAFQDILTFLIHRLPDLVASHHQRLEELAKISDGLFIYAATAARLIAPEAQALRRSATQQSTLLSDIIRNQGKAPKSGLKAVDELYRRILNEVFPEQHQSERLAILHSLVCILQPLSISGFSRMVASLPEARFSDDVDEQAVSLLLDALHSVLYISAADNLIYIYHKSFSDFLLDPDRCGKSLLCERGAQSSALSRACFRIMQQNLRFNMCDLPSSYSWDSEVDGLESRIRRNIRNVPGLEYACRYWTSHVVGVPSSDVTLSALLEDLSEFCGGKVLFWIEAMNLLDSGAHCVAEAKAVSSWLNQLVCDVFSRECIERA